MRFREYQKHFTYDIEISLQVLKTFFFRFAIVIKAATNVYHCLCISNQLDQSFLTKLSVTIAATVSIHYLVLVRLYSVR